MQNKKSSANKKRESRRPIELDEFLMDEDGMFDDEDDDKVTDDTLEFLCLDDEMIESYQRGRGQSPVRGKAAARRSEAYEETEEYEDETYEETEEYEDEAYEEDEEYEDSAEEDLEEDEPRASD
ncbi:MAG: hypothetical protein K2K07_02980, partial [Lachnospiraceae bacterium]|nr:hypothetical protein [Lachnospiraceae bacterium]